MKKVIIAAVASMSAFCAFAAPDSKTDSFKVHFAEKATGPITIDGKFDEADWQRSEPILDWGPTTFLRRQPVQITETWIRYLWDDKYLYVAMRCGEEDFPEENMQRFRKEAFDRSQPVFNRDCVELHIDGNNDRHTRFQVWFSPTEEKQIWWHYDFGWGLLKDVDYGLNAEWDYKVAADDRGWQFEARLSLAHFEMKGREGNICAMEPCRFRLMKHMRLADGTDAGVTTRLWGWATQGQTHKEVDKYGKIIFVKTRPKDIVEGLRLVYKDLDDRKIFVQTMTDYNLVEHGKVRKIPYRQKAEECLAGTEELLVRSERLLSEPAPACYAFRNATSVVAKVRGEFAAHWAKLAAKPDCDIATLAEISEWTAKQSAAVDGSYWSVLAELIRIEKRAREPVKLGFDPKLPAQADEERAYPDPESRKYPFVEWAKDLAVKPGKTLIVVNQYAAYDAVQLQRRLGLNADVYWLRTVEQHAGGCDYWHEGLFSTDLYRRILENVLAKNDYENFVFLGITPQYAGSRLECWFLERILEGRKLVMVADGWNHWGFNSMLRPQDELKAGTLAEIPSITNGDRPFSSKVQPLRPFGVATCTFGKGTITDYNPPLAQCFLVYCAMSPSPFLRPDRAFDDEYLYGATVRAIMQGLGLRGERRMIGVTAGYDGTVAANEPFDAHLTVTGAEPWQGRVKYEVRNTWGKVVQPAKSVAVSVPEGEKHVSLAVEDLPVGRYVVSAWMLDQDDRVMDFVVGEAKVLDKRGSRCACSAACRRVLPPVRLEEIKLGKECFEEREPIVAAVKIVNAVPGMEIEAQIRDVRKRVIERAKFPVDAEKGTASVKFDAKRLSDGCSFLELKVVRNGQVLAESESHEFYRHVPRHDDYEIFADSCDFGGQQGDNRDALLQYFGIQLYQAYGKATTFRGGKPVFRHRISGARNDKGGTMSGPYYAADLNRMFSQEARALRGVNGHFLSLGDDSGDARSFSKTTPEWVPAFSDALRDRFEAEAKAHPDKPLAKLVLEWGASRKFKFVRDSGRWDWSFLFPLMRNVDAFLQCDLQPEDVTLFRSVLPRCYKTIEHFNRHHGTDFKSYNEINEKTIKTLKPYPMPEFVNFCFWLRDRYGKDVAKLNAHWGSDFKDFFSVDDAWIDDQKFKRNFAPSVVRAIYFEDNFINQFRAIAAAVRSVDPSMGVGLCASGLGNAMPEVLEHLNTVGNYLGGEEIELARCLPHVYLGETIGVYGGRLVPLPMREREVYHGLFSGANFSWFWATCYAINGNLSVQPNRARRQLETYREVTRGLGALCVRAKRQNDGIRILASRTAGRLEPLNAGSCTHEQARRSFGEMIADLGLQYDYVTTHQLEKGMPADAKVLVLASVQTLTPAELTQVRAFVQRGGKVLCDEKPAFADNYGKILEKPMLNEKEYELVGFKPAVYNFLRGRGELGTMRTDLFAKFATWGIKPFFRTLNAKGEEVTNVEYSRFVRDGITCLGYEKIANSYETFPMKATLKLEKPAYVYESRSGRSFGLTDAAEIELKGLDCMLFSVLPYEVKGVAVDAPKAVRKGETLVVKAKVEAKAKGEVEQRMATHVVRVELVSPEGYSEERFAPVKPQVLDAPKGEVTAEFPIAYNEAVEYFDLVVTDVMTGKSVTQKVVVK